MVDWCLYDGEWCLNACLMVDGWLIIVNGWCVIMMANDDWYMVHIWFSSSRSGKRSVLILVNLFLNNDHYSAYMMWLMMAGKRFKSLVDGLYWVSGQTPWYAEQVQHNGTHTLLLIHSGAFAGNTKINIYENLLQTALALKMGSLTAVVLCISIIISSPS